MPRYLTAIDDVELLHTRGEQEGAHSEEPAHQEEVEEEGEEREEEGAGDVPDGPTGLSYHVGGQGDPLEAAAEEESEETGEATKHHAEAQPEILVGGDGRNDPLCAGQEDVVLVWPSLAQPVVLSEGVDGQGGRETDGAAKDTEPDSRHRTAIEQTCRQYMWS